MKDRLIVLTFAVSFLALGTMFAIRRHWQVAVPFLVSATFLFCFCNPPPDDHART